MITAEEIRFKVGRAIRTGKLKTFASAMLKYRLESGHSNANVKQSMKKANYDLILGHTRFLQDDAKQLFDAEGHRLIEVAAVAAARHGTSEARFILRKVLNDFMLYKEQGKSIGVFPKDSHLVHNILNSGGTRESVQYVLQILMGDSEKNTQYRGDHFITDRMLRGLFTRESKLIKRKTVYDYAKIYHPNAARVMKKVRGVEPVSTFNMSRLAAALPPYSGRAQTVYGSPPRSVASGSRAMSGSFAPPRQPSQVTSNGNVRNARSNSMLTENAVRGLGRVNSQARAAAFAQSTVPQANRGPRIRAKRLRTANSSRSTQI